MRRFAFAALLVPFVGLAACIDTKLGVEVKADGSGTLTMKVVMDRERAEIMVQQLAGMMGGDPDEMEPEDLFSEDKFSADASKLGEGAKLVSSEKIETDTHIGRTAVYSFPDINKLAVDQNPASFGPEIPGASAQPSEKMSFQMTKLDNGNSLLTVKMPGPKEVAEAVEDKEAGTEEDEEVDPQQMEMAKQFLGGLKFSLTVTVAGEIVKSNSPYVEGSTITLMEMDFDKLLADEAKFKQLSRKKPKNVEEAKAIFKDIEGFKFNLEPETNVEFK